MLKVADIINDNVTDQKMIQEMEENIKNLPEVIKLFLFI